MCGKKAPNLSLCRVDKRKFKKFGMTPTNITQVGMTKKNQNNEEVENVDALSPVSKMIPTGDIHKKKIGPTNNDTRSYKSGRILELLQGPAMVIGWG